MPAVAGVRELHLLESLWLYGNRIGSVGCMALATLLADPNSNINSLHLSGNQINTIGANSLVNSLANNTKLKRLFLINNPLDEKDVQNVLSRLLCNTSSVNEIYSSNHTFEDLSINENGDHGVELAFLLRMNEDGKKVMLQSKRYYVTYPILTCHRSLNWIRKMNEI